MVNIGNGTKVKVEYIGTISLSLVSGHVLELKDVSYIPSIRRNLIFVSFLDKYSYSFCFEKKDYFEL